jgi:hypothetical protein
MKRATLGILCAATALAACHRDAEPQASAAPSAPRVTVPVVVKKGPTAAQLTAGMVEAASQGKSQLGVQLKFELPQRPMIGQPMDVNIAVLPQIDASSADIQVTGGDGLTVSAEDNQLKIPTVEAGQVYRQVVKVTPTTDGVLLLGLIVALKHDDMTESRVFSVPLIVDR